MHKLLKLPDEILRGEPPASVGHREVHLGRPLPLRSASEPLGGLPSYSPPCLANPKNRAELAASHTCLAIILPLIIPLFLSLPLFSLDEDLSLTKPQGDLFSQSWSNFSDFNFYTQLSPPHPRRSLSGCTFAEFILLAVLVVYVLFEFSK